MFAPLANFLLDTMGGWKGANLVLAGIILNCAIFGALMRPLTYPKKNKEKPLMQRMYEEKRLQMERGSIGGSYFTVTMPDGSTQKKLKMPINADPGVHSSLALDQLAQSQIHPVPTLPTITESRIASPNGTTSSSEQSPPIEMKAPIRERSRNSESDVVDTLNVDNNIPRNASQPVFSQVAGIPKNGSVPSFRSRKNSEHSGRFQPSLNPIKASSRADLENGDVRMLKRHSHGSLPFGSKNSDEFVSIGHKNFKFQIFLFLLLRCENHKNASLMHKIF